MRRAGFSSAENLADHLHGSRFVFQRWENGKAKPGPKWRPRLAEVSPDLAALIAELPARESPSLVAQVQRQGQELAELRALVEQLRAERENPGRERAGGRSS